MAEARWLDSENKSSEINLGDSRIPQADLCSWLFSCLFCFFNLLQKQKGESLEDDSVLHSVVSDSLRPMDCMYPARLSQSVGFSRLEHWSVLEWVAISFSS